MLLIIFAAPQCSIFHLMTSVVPSLAHGTAWTTQKKENSSPSCGQIKIWLQNGINPNMIMFNNILVSDSRVSWKLKPPRSSHFKTFSYFFFPLDSYQSKKKNKKQKTIQKNFTCWKEKEAKLGQAC